MNVKKVLSLVIFGLVIVAMIGIMIPCTSFAASNLAEGKSATADCAQSNNPCTNGNDDSTTTRWCATDSGKGHWWKVDLGSSKKIKGTEVMWEKKDTVYQYKIEVSEDDTNWVLAVDMTASTSTEQTQTDKFTAQARYVRITITGMPSARIWASFYEFRVF